MKKSSWQERREGRQRLVAWLGDIGDTEGKMEPMSGLGEATFGHLTMDNLDAIMIYAAPKGGWHCDIVLKNTPPGVPNAFGTRVKAPCRTREDAEGVGRTMLAAIVGHIRANPQPEPPKPVFLLHGCTFRLLPELFDMVRQRMPETLGEGGPYGSELGAVRRIEEIIEQLFPNGFDLDQFNAMNRDSQVVLLSVLHGAVLAGVFRYPLRIDGEPVDGVVG